MCTSNDVYMYTICVIYIVCRRYQCAMLPVELLQWHNPAMQPPTPGHRRLLEPSTSTAPNIYVLTKPLYALPPAFACSLLLRRLQHHAALGFDGVLLYERGQMLPDLLHVGCGGLLTVDRRPLTADCACCDTDRRAPRKKTPHNYCM